MSTIISNVCRVEQLSEEVVALATPGVVEIPKDLMAPRQVYIQGKEIKVAATLKRHRGSLIPTISTETAAQLVGEGSAEYKPQSLLSYTREDYLADPDVKKDIEEYERVKTSDAELVIVAVIGENRSPLAVRNIVSSCQPEKLKADAEGAVECSDVILIED